MAVSLNEIIVLGIRAADLRIAEATQYLEWLQDLWRKIQAGSCGLRRFDPNQIVVLLWLHVDAHMESEGILMYT